MHSNLKVEPVQQTDRIRQYDIDGNEIYNVKSGQTVADIDFKEVLQKVLEEGKQCVK